MKKTVAVSLLALFCLANTLVAQTASLWKEIPESSIIRTGQPFSFPPLHRTYSLSLDAMKLALQSAPMERTPKAQTDPLDVSIPFPDGSLHRFAVVEVIIMEPGLAAQYPEIHTYAGRGIDDPAATIRLDVTSAGFHSMVRGLDDVSFIDPYGPGDVQHYVAYSQEGSVPPESWSCTLIADPNVVKEIQRLVAEGVMTPTGPTLRTYRLACAATGEYTAYFGGTVPLGQAAIVTAVNRVDGVYETDLAIRMVLVANNSSVVYVNPSSDPFTNNDGSIMLGQNQTNMTSVIGSANYDIGHVFSTGGGGVAYLGCVCSASNKAGGVTGSPSPTGDSFWIDYVAHEMGHQFGGNHTFNSTTSNCGGGNRSASAAYEPGSGTTIMAYAGICGADDLQVHSDPFFHTKSFDEIVAYTNSGGGNSCAATTSTGNAAPVVNAGTGGFTIPISTPFTLTGSATDPNGDPLTYCWEEYDLGPAGSPNSPSGTAPIFRSFSPKTSPSRTFPKQSDLLNNVHTIGELLPTYTRALTFRLTARDNRTGGGGVDRAQITFSATSTAGPFLVTAPNTALSWAGNSAQTVTWNVANTTASPVSCPQVSIRLSTDGGVTFPTVLASNTSNDGSEAIVVPNTPTTTARIKVEAANNIFFDLSNTNFTITFPTLAAPILVLPADNATQQPESLTVRWNSALTATSYRLQLGTDSTFAVGVLVDDSTIVDTSRAVSGLSQSTRYFWRVRSKNGLNTSGFSPLRRFTTVAPPPAATLVAPAGNAVSQPLPVAFRWNIAPAATAYRLQVASDSAFGVPMIVVDSTVTDTSLVAGGLSYSSQYFWRVTSQNVIGTGPASAVRKFMTLAPPPPVVLAVPEDNAVGQPDSLFLRWHAAVTAASYRLQLATDSTFGGGMVVDDSLITDTSYAVNGLTYSTAYFWRVGAENAAGVGPFSGARRFMTATPPPPVSLLSPPDLATGQPASLTFRWHPASQATSYRLTVSTDSTFASGLVLDDSTLADTSATVSGLAYSTEFYWRVRGQNAAGVSPLLEVYRFTTLTVPSAVVLASPPDGALDQSLSPVLRWHASATATSYRLQVTADSTWSGGLVVNDSTIADTSAHVHGLFASTRYFWRVQAHNPAGDGSLSVARRFTTIALPGVVMLAGPPGDTTFASSTVTLSWHPVALAAFYWVEWSADSSFSEPFVDSTVTGTSRSIAQLNDSTVYFWKVRAGNGAGWGPFSDTRGFATHFATVVSIPLAAGWNMVSNPVITENDSVSELFPGSVFTHAFAFEATTGYAQSSRMINGSGYWAKFADDQVQPVAGLTCTRDTFMVRSGWNMVGSISIPVDTGSIVSVPPSLRASVWYGYSGAYSPATQLIPGQAYWVKAAGDGMFVLTIPTLTPPARAEGSAPGRAVQHPGSGGKQQVPKKQRQG
jgi:hypothetical protein